MEELKNEQERLKADIMKRHKKRDSRRIRRLKYYITELTEFNKSHCHLMEKDASFVKGDCSYKGQDIVNIPYGCAVGKGIAYAKESCIEFVQFSSVASSTGISQFYITVNYSSLGITKQAYIIMLRMLFKKALIQKVHSDSDLEDLVKNFTLKINNFHQWAIKEFKVDLSDLGLRYDKFLWIEDQSCLRVRDIEKLLPKETGEEGACVTQDSS